MIKMKFFMATLFVGFCSANILMQQDGLGEDSCHYNVIRACQLPSSQQVSSERICDARYGGIVHVETEIQMHINTQLNKSYEYLLLATYYSSYQKNLPGFRKLYKDLSDRSFEDAMDLIRHITRRGGRVDFSSYNGRRSDSFSGLKNEMKWFEADELHSIAMALDNEKQLSKSAMHVHNRAMSAPSKDPHIARYIEQHHMDGQSANVRLLSGYVNDLAKIMEGEEDPSLAVYLFDKHLHNQFML